MSATPSMAKLDRFEWTAGMRFTCYGLRVGIRATDARVLEEIGDYLPPARRPVSGAAVDRLYSFVAGDGPHPRARRYHRVFREDQQLIRTTNLVTASQVLESDLRLYVAEQAHRRIFVHAGVVGWRGRALVIPGKSYSGKSRLVAALVKAGATYFSDEFAVFDPRGRVHPFSSPLSMRGDSWSPDRRLSAADMGGSAGTAPLPVGLFALAEYREGASWTPQALSRGQGLLGLLSNTLPVRSKPAETLATLERAVARAPVVKGIRGDAEETAPALLAALESGTLP